MLELFGDNYIIEHIQVEMQKETETLMFQNYIADGLYCLCGGKLNRRYHEIYEDMHGERKKPQSAAEIKKKLLDKIRKGG